MDRVDRVKELANQQQQSLVEDNSKTVSKTKKALSKIINDNINRSKEVLGQHNKYKDYMDNNKELIKNKLSLNIEVETLEEAKVALHQVDFRYLFGFDVSLKETFDCDLIYNERTISFACINKEEADLKLKEELIKYFGAEINKSGCYERFGMYVRTIKIMGDKIKSWIEYSKNREKFLYFIGDKGEVKTYFVTATYDILDLYQIIFNCDIKMAVKELCQLVDIRVKEMEVVIHRYERNKEFVETNLEKELLPMLYELIGKHIPKLLIILKVGIDKAFYHDEYVGKLEFSCSMSYFAGLMNRSKSSISPVINTFVLLGFLEKIETSEVKFSRGNNNEITHFIIPKYNEELLQKAEIKANVMLCEGERVTPSELTYTKCLEKFGKEVANSIFKDKATRAKAI